MKIRIISKKGLKRSLIILGIFLFTLLGVWKMLIMMPGKSYRGELPPLTVEEQQLAKDLQRDLEQFGEFGEHNFIFYDNLPKNWV